MTGKTIAQNASRLLIATAGQKILAFVAFTIAANFVGPAVIGEYFYAVAITSIFVTIGDLGLTPVVIRAIASDAEKGKRFFDAALRLKAILVPAAVVAVMLFGFIRGIDRSVFVTLLIMVLVMSADSLHLLFYGVLRGKQILRYEASGMFIGQILTTIVAVSAALLGWGAPGLACALLVASSWNLGWSWMKTGGTGVQRVKASRSDLYAIVRQALPFALAGIFVKMYSYLDTLMIEAFHGHEAVGAYGVAYKVTYALQFVPLVFVAALYPAMSSVYAQQDRERLKSVFAGSLRLMAIVGVPIAAGLSAIAPWFIPLAYGKEFLGSVAPMTILTWALIPIFLDFPVGSLLNATHRAHLKTIAMGAAMVVNAVLNFCLVPAYGPVGAAMAGVGSFTFLFLIGAFYARKELPSFAWLASLIARSAVVAAVIWVSVRAIGTYAPPIFSVMFGAAVGTTALLVTRLLTKEDLRLVIQWLRRRIRPSEIEEEDVHA